MATQTRQKSAPNERRGARRYPAFFPVRLLPGEGFRRLCICQDVSTTGSRMMTQSPLSIGQHVLLALFNPLTEDEPRKVGARVVRVGKRPAENRFWKYEAALRFDETVDEMEPQFNELSEQQRRSGL